MLEATAATGKHRLLCHTHTHTHEYTRIQTEEPLMVKSPRGYAGVGECVYVHAASVRQVGAADVIVVSCGSLALLPFAQILPTAGLKKKLKWD